MFVCFRKHGLESEAFPGFDGLADFDHSGSYQDDEDGSENQSMTSHDGLLIDESFESVKRENESPSPIDTVPEKVTVTSKYFSNPHHLQSTGQMKGKALSNGVYPKNQDAYENPIKLERISSNSSMNNSCAGNIEQTPEEKTGRISSSDGNQNILPNGHGPRNSEDWMTDLAKYDGW